LRTVSTKPARVCSQSACIGTPTAFYNHICIPANADEGRKFAQATKKWICLYNESDEDNSGLRLKGVTELKKAFETLTVAQRAPVF
jgi:hypothetical protein